MRRAYAGCAGPLTRMNPSRIRVRIHVRGGVACVPEGIMLRNRNMPTEWQYGRTAVRRTPRTGVCRVAPGLTNERPRRTVDCGGHTGYGVLRFHYLWKESTKKRPFAAS